MRTEGSWLDALVETAPATYDGPLPLMTVVVCTRNRTEELEVCLSGLTRLDYPDLDLLVVDNAPSNSATALLVASYPAVRYIQEPRPGLNWARNRGILEAYGDIVAFTDDDVVVDPGWVRALAGVFAAHSEVMGVTGLVEPYELETEAQLFFELYGGFGKGYRSKRYRVDHEHGRRETWHIAAWLGGTGANMAYRRSLFERIGSFDPALDVGTVTHGGGDLEMFFRVLQEGYTLVYEPNAVVRHRHRRTYSELRRQITTWGIGFYSYLVRSALMYPGTRLAIARFGLAHLWRRNLRRLLVSVRYPPRFPRDLIVAELWGSLIGLFCYPRARRLAEKIIQTYGRQMSAP
jgi:GT2 family glycosyltransferase